MNFGGGDCKRRESSQGLSEISPFFRYAHLDTHVLWPKKYSDEGADTKIEYLVVFGFSSLNAIVCGCILCSALKCVYILIICVLIYSFCSILKKLTWNKFDLLKGQLINFVQVEGAHSKPLANLQLLP